ncbi:MAG: AarF/ABC1/UbiB kinase family protein [Acidobacteria bacterium]|nr:MAG: AarF/ABC1/UbiB kinase family protein [Acidobacteriota bacterium]
MSRTALRSSILAGCPALVVKSPIPSKLRVVQRAREVAAVFVKHGFSDLADHFQLPHWIRGGSDESAPSTAVDTGGGSSAERTAGRAHASAERLARAIEELRPTFVKLGQFLVSREDLLPEGWAEPLARLQDDVQPVPWEEIHELLVERLGERHEALFRHIDPDPLAAGSIAQVHRATLVDGTRVVLKILRPGVRGVIQADLEVLSLLASFVEQNANLGFSPSEVLEQFAQDRMEELDLLHEGRATDRLRRLFRDHDEIVFPEVHWQVTTPRILVLEELLGTPFTQVDVASLPLESRRTLVRRGSLAVVEQCLQHGFFHADPHAGNLILLEGDRIGFVDCGIVGYLSQEQRDLLAEMIHAVFDGRVRQVQQVACRLVDADPGLEDDRALQRSLHGLMVDFDQATLESLRVTSLLQRLFRILRQHEARIPADLLKLVKTLSTLESLAARLDPEFSVVEEITRQTRATLLSRFSGEALRRRAAALLGAYGGLLEELPHDVRALLDRLRRSELELKLSHGGLDRLTAALVFASRLLATAVLVSSLLVAGSIVLLASRDQSWLHTAALVALGCALLFGGIVVVRHFRYDQ